MIEKYYEEELRYLIESGREFARAHPDRARFLNIDAVGDRDPYVERLFEGFAFLAGRIREKLDDSFPELTEGLINLLWPHFVCEIPSITIVEFRPRKGILQESRTIQRGAEILSDPVGQESVLCHFTTTQDVMLHPLMLGSIDRHLDTKGQATLRLKFQLEPGVQWNTLSLSPLRLYIHAELPTAMMLHEYFTTKVVSARIRIESAGIDIPLDPDEAVTPGGLTPDESLLPRDNRSFWGYALLQEYFCYPEKFLFVDLHGFDLLPQFEGDPEQFEYSVTFRDDFYPGKPFSHDAFRLYCTPAANIYRRDIEPINVSGKESEYRCIADSGYPRSVQVHSLVSVTGIDRNTGERNYYEPFYSFRNLGRKGRRTYAPHYTSGPDGKREVNIQLGGSQLKEGVLHEENLALEAWCTNGIIPREEVREGGINKPGSGFPDYVMITNITRPTLPFHPPRSEEYLWVFLSHLGSTYASLAASDSLKSFLRLYDWSGSEGRARRIEAITGVETEPAEATVMGCVIRGVRCSVSVQEAEFQDMGDLHLFGQVLKEFLSHYVSINSYLELVLILKPSAKAMRWSSLRGKQWLI
jgi:type VI secretion system protein ImpG